MSMRPLCLILLTVLCVASAAPAAAQALTLQKIPEVELEVKFVTDADGLLQFKPVDEDERKCQTCRGTGNWDCFYCTRREHKNETCLECDKTKKAPCRHCAGEGQRLDPLEEVLCVYCGPIFGEASGLVRCGLCGGGGKLTERDRNNNVTEKKCGSCKGAGHWACPVCDGSRRIQVARVKKKHPGQAKARDLVKVRDSLQTVLTSLEGWEPINRPGKNDKALEGFIKKHKKNLPALEGFLEVLELVVGGQVKAGSSYQDFEPKMIFHYQLYRDRTIYLLRQELAALDQYIKRAEHNENVKEPSEQEELLATLPWI